MAYDHRNLDVWKRSRKLVKLVYAVTASFPKDERFGLTSQLRRAAVSIPANLAEGYGRQQQTDRRRFIEIALGSASELDTLLTLAEDLGFLVLASTHEVVAEAAGVNKMLFGLWSSFDPSGRARRPEAVGQRPEASPVGQRPEASPGDGAVSQTRLPPC